jgi:uncharacterized protein involved in exopolysaccharide biosynthesis
MIEAHNAVRSGFEIAPSDLLHRLWRRTHWVIAIVMACTLLSWAYLRNADPLFEVRANLLLQPNSHGLVVAEKQRGQRDSEFVNTQSEILGSRQLLTRATESYRSSQAGQRSDVAAPVDGDELIQRLMDELSAKPVVGAQVINISLRWGDREQGQLLMQHLIDQYRKFLFELDQGGQIESLRTLSQYERELREELTGLQDRFRSLRLASSLVGSTNSGLSPQQTLLKDLGSAYTKVRFRRIGLENCLAIIDDVPQESVVMRREPIPPQPREVEFVVAKAAGPGHAAGTIAPILSEQSTEFTEFVGSQRGWSALQMLSDLDLKGLQDPVAIQAELFEAEVRRLQLVERYREGHPELRAVENQIADWKQRLQTLICQAPLTLERQLRASKLEEDRLHSLYQEELETAKQLDQHRLEQEHLQTQIDQLQSLHNSTATQLADLRLNNQVTAESGAALRVTVLEEPVASVDPAWPNEKLVLGAGLLMGLLGSSLLALIPVAGRSN